MVCPPIRAAIPWLTLAAAGGLPGLSAQETTAIGDLLIDADRDTLVDRIGDRVTIAATVTTGAYRALRLDEREYRITVQDSTGGLRIVADRKDKLQALAPGVEVRLRGTLGQYYGCPYLSVEKILEIVPAKEVAPLRTSLAEFDGERLNGRLIRLAGGLHFDRATRHYVVSNGDRSVRLFLRPTPTYVPVIAAIEEGCSVDVTGVVEQYDPSTPFTEGYRIRPRRLGDVVVQPPTISSEWLRYGSIALGTGAVLGLLWFLLRLRRRQQRAVSLSTQQAERMHALGTLAGGIAHEFNNYLMAIMGFAELARQDVPKHSSARDNLSEVLEAGNRAKALIEQIRDFSRDDDTIPEPVSAYAAFREGMRLLRAVLPASIAVVEDFAEDSGNIAADRGQLNQLLINLGTNAAKAMLQGGKLTVRLQRQSLDAEQREELGLITAADHVLLEVIDTGVGMDEATLAQIYDPFFSTRSRSEGTGLGLSVVHAIVARLEGTIHVQSALGEGTTFRIYLPLTMAPLQVPPPPPATTEDAPQGGHVLLVDDQANLARLGAQLFRALGFEVTEHTDALDALAAVEATPSQFDLVVTDLAMPNLTGLELSRRIRAIRNDLPVLLMTGNIDEVGELEREAAGIDAVLLKPFRLDDLRERVLEAVGTQ